MIQVQIHTLIVEAVVEAARTAEESNMWFNVEIAKLLVFNREIEKVGGFITAYRLYLRIKIRKTSVEEQI